LSSKNITYGLLDPRDNRLRYVGQSSIGLERPQKHWKHKKLRERKDHCHNWIRLIIADGLLPEVVIIEELDDRLKLNKAEMKWIKKYRDDGLDLTNMTDGGEGTHGCEPWCKGQQLSKEHRDKIGKAIKGRVPWNKGKKTGRELLGIKVRRCPRSFVSKFQRE